METNPYAQRFEAAKQLLALFRMERSAYLAVNVIVLVFLIGYGIYSAVTSGGNLAVITAFFGMTGVVTFTTGKMLRMWSEVFSVVMEGGGPTAAAPRPATDPESEP